MFDLDTYMRERMRLIDAELNKHTPDESVEPRRLHSAMRHSLFGAGKRMRPILCIAAAEAVGAPATTNALIAGAAVELLHTYTLIHDDLPAMDNDTLRRGRPTCHVAFDEATAILAGDALLTLSFEVLSRVTCAPPYSATDLVLELASASGSTGVIGGQMADIEGEDRELSIEQLIYIHTHKTGDLIKAAVRIGAMTAGATAEHLKILSAYAVKIGLAFQIADDVLNATGNAEELGKTAGSDAAANKMTYVRAYGVEGAKEKAQQLVREATEGLNALPGPTDALRALADYVISRRR